ncbi:MAG: GEVED domain-containing protein [Flavobacteriaceae bacterium]|jgi:hypothetical protein|nr:GEVED domain-containing protein [Flavobacteriaceae bacterium]
MKNYYALLIVVLLCIMGVAQEHTSDGSCGSEYVNQKLVEEDPSFAQRIKEFDTDLSQMMKSGKKKNFYKADEDIYEIPIVIHVIHTGEAIGTAYNKSDADIHAWVDFTNKVYEGIAPNLVGDPERVSIPIRFVLAKRDMNCNPTNGIVRVDGSVIPEYAEYGLKYGSSNGVEESQIKALSRWDPNYYYNIYVVNTIGGGSISGFAYYAGASTANDGSFMRSSVVGTSNTTFPHEMGHAMGLRHTFDGANNTGGNCPPTTGDCTIDDDKVCDTERSPSAYSDHPCKTGADINICTGTYYQGVQNNIMNYGHCLDRFTEGQKDRAIAQLLQHRESLINSNAGKEPDVTENLNVKPACVPTSITNLNNPNNMGPANVTFGDIKYNSKGYNMDGFLFYIDNNDGTRCYVGTTFTKLKVGVPVPLTISVLYNNQNVRTYIDYNDNGIFDVDTETVFSTQINANSSATINVTPPEGAVLNTPLRMRVIADFITSSISPCYNPLYGQIEDFAVILTSSSSCEKVWKGIDDNWDNADNWDPVGVPNSSHCIKIPSVFPHPVIRGNAEVGSIELIGELKIDAEGHLKVTRGDQL